ncbi:hypothetical protein JCM17478_22190 [Thermopirellula anaerolimosa]
MMSISIGPGIPKKTAKGRDTAETSEIENAGVAQDDTPMVSVGVIFHYIAAIRPVKLPSNFREPCCFAKDGRTRAARANAGRCI